MSISQDEAHKKNDDASHPKQKNKFRSSPVTVTRFDSFYMSLRDVEHERRDRCSDSLRRLRQYGLTKNGVAISTRESTIQNNDINDNDVVFLNGGKDDKSNDNSPPEVVQNAYGATKQVWEWGKNVPVLSDVLGLTEGVTNKFFEITIQVEDVERDLVIPNLKKLDNEIVNPIIGAVFNAIGPALSVGDEVVVKPVMHLVIPHIMGREDEEKTEQNDANDH